MEWLQLQCCNSNSVPDLVPPCVGWGSGVLHLALPASASADELDATSPHMWGELITRIQVNGLAPAIAAAIALHHLPGTSSMSQRPGNPCRTLSKR